MFLYYNPVEDLILSCSHGGSANVLLIECNQSQRISKLCAMETPTWCINFEHSRSPTQSTNSMRIPLKYPNWPANQVWRHSCKSHKCFFTPAPLPHTHSSKAESNPLIAKWYYLELWALQLITLKGNEKHLKKSAWVGTELIVIMGLIDLGWKLAQGNCRSEWPTGCNKDIGVLKYSTEWELLWAVLNVQTRTSIHYDWQASLRIKTLWL